MSLQERENEVFFNYILEVLDYVGHTVTIDRYGFRLDGSDYYSAEEFATLFDKLDTRFA